MTIIDVDLIFVTDLTFHETIFVGVVEAFVVLGNYATNFSVALAIVSIQVIRVCLSPKPKTDGPSWRSRAFLAISRTRCICSRPSS
jgi:hypothetical protein